MKRFLKKSLICILILFLLINFASASIINYTYATDDPGILESVFTGLIGLIAWIPRAKVMAGLTGLNVLVSGFAQLGMGAVEAVESGDFDFFVTPFHVFFNKIPLLDVNFFNFSDGVSDTVLSFRIAVAGWYYSIRLIAAMILAVILIYIGIRMALSTTASEKVLYKEMLVNWATSLALLFLLHYIMIFILSCNSALVDALKNICTDLDLTDLVKDLTIQALGLELAPAFAALIMYAILMYQTVIFLFAYVKRMLTIGFLIMIAPLITITYSIDKIGDGKAQALNIWLKEFSYNILIQPFHCILFAAFANIAFDLVGVGTWSTQAFGLNISKMVLAIACVQFIKTGENLVKKIFGFGQASSLADMAAGVAATGAAIKYGGKVAAKGGAFAAKTTGKIAEKVRSNEKLTKATNSLKNTVGSTLGKATTVLNNYDKDGNLTAKGHRSVARKAEKQTQKDKEGNSRLNVDKAYVENYNKIEAEMKQKFTNKKETKARKLAEKREDAIDKKLISEYGEKGFEKLKASAGYEEARKKAGEEVDAEKASKREKRQKITGAVGKAVVAPVNWGDNIIKGSNLGGVVTGLVGFGGGLDTALAFGNIGSGFLDGYLKNSYKTIKKSNEGAAVASMNFAGNVDIASHTEDIYVRSLNGEFDKVTEQLNKIMDKLQELKVSKDVTKDFRVQVNQNILNNPAGLDEAFINSFAEQNGIKDENSIGLLRDYVSLAADANYANKINTATSAGISIDQLIGALSDIQVTVDTSKIEKDIDEVNSNLNKFERDVSNVNNQLNNEGN